MNMLGQKLYSRFAFCSLVTLFVATGVVVGQDTQPAAAATQPATATTQPAAPAITFTAVTASAGIDFVQTVGDDVINNVIESAGGGCGFIDYDGDRLLDIYLVNGCWKAGVSDANLDPARRDQLAAATDRLYHNRGDGTFEDVTVAAGVNRPAYGLGVIAADYDNDGDTDLYVTNDGPNFLYRNDGKGTFTEVAAELGVADPLCSTGAAFLDYDNDRRLDLYVANFDTGTADAATSQPAACSDHLYHANPDGTFTDVTHAAGLDALGPSRTRNVLVIDFDRDGWPDIFITRAGGENALWRNKHDGTFENVAATVGLAHGPAEPTAIEYRDIDQDGWSDLWVGGADGGRFYHSVDRGHFEDVTERWIATPDLRPLCGWGAVSADFDLDTRLDFFVAAGDTQAEAKAANRVLRGSDTSVFTDVSATAGTDVAQIHVARGVARGDFDNDGDIDLLINNLNAGPTLLRNDTPRTGRHWLTLSLVGTKSNRDSVGARVRLHLGPSKYVQALHTGGSYLSQHDARLHFGLGHATQVERIDIVWPDGMLQTVTFFPADTPVQVIQPPEHGWKTGPRKPGP